MGQYTSSDQIVPSVEKISEKKNFHLSDGGNFIGQPWEELIQESMKFKIIFNVPLSIFKYNDFQFLKDRRFSGDR